MDIRVNTKKVKDTRDEEYLVTDNSKFEVIKTQGYFELLECSKKFSKYLDMRYKRMCM